MPTHYKGTKSEELALNGYITLMRASGAVSAVTSSHLAGIKLTPTQFGTLESLYFIGDLTQSELAKKILCSKANLSLQLDTLEKQQLIKRKAFYPDRRSVTVSLTRQGREFIKPVFDQHLKFIEKAMQGLNSAELAQLRSLCKKLGKHAEEIQETYN